ncbi:hypothetical protein B5S33_g4773 [[Candida] boidinii]|nr:hypothetical protein B5S33_g4773 [[Candida] boidinii]
MTDAGNEEKVIYSSSLLFGKSPIESMEILKLRQNQLKFINRELADWFTAYGRLRLQYVDELKKLRIRGEKAFVDTTNPTLQNTKIDSLGLCTPMWSSVMKIINHEITLFDSSTRKMGRDMIAPLKTYSRNNDSNLIEMDDLISLAHNIDSREKNGKDTSILRNEWSERAPYFFEIFENYDYERLLLLKDIFLKYETDLNDVVGVFKKENETALEHCLAFNPTDEIKRFSDDAMKTEFPIENIKESINESDKSNQFTSSSAITDSHNSRHRQSEINDNSNGQADKKSHRRSKLFSSNPLSLGHHHNNSKKVNSSRTNSVATNNTVVHTAPPVIGGANHANEVASISSSGTSNTKKEKKEKTSMRSKFGSMLRKKKKNKDTPKYSSNLSATPIPESETSSIDASVSNVNTSNNNNANSNTAHPNSTRRSSTIQPSQQQTERNAHNDYLPQPPNALLTAPNSVQGSNYQQQKQPPLPSSYADAPVDDIKPLPKDNAYGQLTTPTSTSGQPLSGQQLPLPRTESFPTMQPTRRSNSINSGVTQSSIQPSMTESPIKNQSQSYASTTGNNNAPIYQEEESPIQVTTPIPPIQNFQDYHNNVSGTAPPPPSARKHLSAPLDMISPVNNYQEKSIVPDTTQPISSANINGGYSSLAPPSSSTSDINGLRTHHQPPPPPPQQRRVLSMADSITEGQVSSQPITPVATGSSSPIRQQNTGVIARNTTGSGGLINGQIQHPSLSKPGLNASIVELYNATFKDGELSRSNAVGEVAFSYILGDETQQIPQKIDLEVKSDDELPTFMPNPQFLQQISNSSYSIFDPSQIYLKTVGAMKYMLNDPTPPIVITPIWKHESTKSTVMISIKPSDEIIEKLSADPSLSLKLSSVLISVSLDNAQTISAATKPAGSFNKERNRVTWNFSTTGLTFNSEHLEDKFISRFMLTGNENNAKEGDGGVQIRFNILNENGTDLCQSDISKFGFYINEEKIVDPFDSQDNFNSNKTEDDSNWTEVPILKTLIAGGYSGHA